MEPVQGKKEKKEGKRKKKGKRKKRRKWMYTPGKRRTIWLVHSCAINRGDAHRTASVCTIFSCDSYVLWRNRMLNTSSRPVQAVPGVYSTCYFGGVPYTRCACCLCTAVVFLFFVRLDWVVLCNYCFMYVLRTTVVRRTYVVLCTVSILYQKLCMPQKIQVIHGWCCIV